jgi:hypothetical protein
VYYGWLETNPVEDASTVQPAPKAVVAALCGEGDSVWNCHWRHPGHRGERRIAEVFVLDADVVPDDDIEVPVPEGGKSRFYQLRMHRIVIVYEADK